MSPSSPEFSDRIWKLIEAMYRLMPEEPRMVTYEDIVVKAWEMYPDDFGLRGYSDRYPDASDIHKPLYNVLKSRGWAKTGPPGQKKFALTPLGWEGARLRFGQGPRQQAESGRLSRISQQELQHLRSTIAVKYFMSGSTAELLDTDFYDFYRTSVRAKAQEFEGRLASVKSALAEGLAKDAPAAKELSLVDEFLRERFASLVRAKTDRKRKETPDGQDSD